MQQIVFLTTRLDPKGEFVTVKESIMDMALTDENWSRCARDGLKAIATLDANAGNSSYARALEYARRHRDGAGIANELGRAAPSSLALISRIER